MIGYSQGNSDRVYWKVYCFVVIFNLANLLAYECLEMRENLSLSKVDFAPDVSIEKSSVEHAI